MTSPGTTESLSRICRVLVVSLVVSAVAAIPSATALHAQPGPLLSLYADSELVRPGNWSSITVIANGAGSHATLAIAVPSALEIDPHVTCTHSQTYCDRVWIQTAGSQTNRIDVRAPGPFLEPGSSTVRITVSFAVFVPNDIPPGSRFEIAASVNGLFYLYDPLNTELGSAVLEIEVTNPDGSRAAPPLTPTPYAITDRVPEARDSPLTFIIWGHEVRAGELVTMEPHIPRSATWELPVLDSFAFLVYAENSRVTNQPDEFIDSTGERACTAGSENDPVPAIERAVPGSLSMYQDTITLQVGADASVGQRLLVCVELIGFSGSTEAFSWNAYDEILVKD